MTSSSGNFASGLAYAWSLLNLPQPGALTVVPSHLNSARCSYIKDKGATLVMGGQSAKERAEKVQEVMKETGRVFISSATDYTVMAGQATSVKEFTEDIKNLDKIIVPIGGGGNIAGTCIYINEKKLPIEVYGVEPEVRDVASRSLAEGKLVEVEHPDKSIADGTAGNLGEAAY